MPQVGTVPRGGRRVLALGAALGPLVVSGLFALPALAQQSPGPTSDATPTASPQTYDAAFFTVYNPLTAADMLSRIPGFEINDGDDRRGFGATGGNVLINGERPSSKATITDQLKRIPASSVLRVEMRSGGGSADVAGQSRVANVILKPSASTPLTWIAGARHLQYSNRLGYTLQLSKSFSLGEHMELALDLQAPNIRGRTVAFESVRLANGALTEYREQYTQPNYNGLQLAANLKWRASQQDRVNLNALLYPTDNSNGIGSIALTPASTIKSQTFGRADYPTNQRAELGGDWEHTFSDTFHVKLVALATASTIDQTQRLDTWLPAGLYNTQTLISNAETGERVGRAAATWKISKEHTLEFGGEGAFNFRETSLRLTNQAPGGPVVPVVFPVADTRVEELRSEAFASDTWTISEQLSLTTGFTFEASRITQTGDASKEREFKYPKMQLTASWTPGASDDFRASLRRDIAQLDFAEFASSFNAIDATTIVGNPDLEPEKAWKAKLEWEHHSAGAGAFTVGLFHDEVQDVRDLVVIGANDAYGNIGDGTRTGVELKGSLPLKNYGLPGAELRFTGVFQETHVTDPLTGETRSFSSGDNVSPAPRSGGAGGGPPPLAIGNRDFGYIASFRQDFPGLKSSFSFSVARNADREEYKRLEHITLSRAERVDINWETTAIEGLTIRIGFGNIFSPQEVRERTFYTPDRGSGVIQRVERRGNKGGSDGTRSYTLQLAGKF
ncbi:MAG: TonB-dependent receptor [Hyphomonadaceae bacterium]